MRTAPQLKQAIRQARAVFVWANLSESYGRYIKITKSEALKILSDDRMNRARYFQGVFPYARLLQLDLFLNCQPTKTKANNMTIDDKIKALVAQVQSILENYQPDTHESVDAETLQMTFASDDLKTFAFQSGDNSFSGACYGFRHWGVVELGPDSDCEELAIDAVEQIADGNENQNES